MPVSRLTTEADLERVLDSHDTVVIDFWAPSCGACKEFLPVFEAAAARHPDLAFCRVNTRESPDLRTAFGIEAIPTLIAIRERIMIASEAGSLPAPVFEDLLQQIRAVDMDDLREEMAAAEEHGTAP